jgi:hypothetical protein
MRADAADRIRAFAAEAVSSGRLPDGAGRLIAVGWATVEADRAIHELAHALGIDHTSFRAAAASPALGATCLIAPVPLPGGTALAVLEPATEGRIAAALARWDEGPVVAWYAAGALDARGAPGPFGPERLAGRDPLTGPHRLLVAVPPGTIAT